MADQLRLKILFVSSGLDPKTGGTASAAIAIAIAAARMELAVTLAAPASGDAALLTEIKAKLAVEGVTLKLFPFASWGGKRSIAWGVSPALNRYLRHFAAEFNIIHAHSAWVMSSFTACRGAKRAGRPFVLMPHESFTRFDRAKASMPILIGIKDRLRRYYLRRLDTIVLTSTLERLTSDLITDSRAMVMALPVYDERTPPLPIDTGRATATQLVIGFLGRVEAKKNLGLLIEAIAATSDVRLVIAGDGTLRDTLVSTAKALGVSNRVEWRGFVDTAEKARFFDDIDVLAMPSSFECFGLAAAEALVAGVPVIVSDTSGIAEFLGGDPVGLIIPPTRQALIVALEKAKNPSYRALWQSNAGAIVAREFSYRNYGEKLYNFYHQLYANRKFAPL